MAEVKNSFLSSKMNKDLDDRLIPNSQYRDALNISIGKSEQDQIGTVQNILGNNPLYTIPSGDIIDFVAPTCIGVFMDDQNGRIYQFLTNYTDPNPSQNTLVADSGQDIPGNGWVMAITVYDYNTTPNYKTIVSGTFLNFSTTNQIIGVNLVEGLLFFTDNRNQPRKINANNAILNPLYYYNEAQISVAKYAPLEPISLFKKATATVISNSGTTYVVDPEVGTIIPGMTMIATGLSGSDYAYVMSVSIEMDGTHVELYEPTPTVLSAGTQLTFLTSTMTNQSSSPTWPGDPAFLEDKYVRFSYRFKFDDNEYSLFAPFTQIAYIPKQKGFFINGDETSAYKSTVIKWMENNVNNIELLIPLPDLGSKIRNSYKIIQLDILYKESDSLAVKVLDSITYNDLQIESANTNIYNYPYQSQKPYKTLPEDQITRVYDNVPTRALAQEISGNRVIYGNFYNMYSAPENINYNTSVQPKSDIFSSFIEYPNHTLKQNRNYQVGFILADKFGRQSSVILSTVDLVSKNLGTSVNFGGSTVYAPYQSENMVGMPDTRNWFGNALLVLVNDPISSARNIPNGTPGLYAIPTSTNGFTILAGATTNIPDTLNGFAVYKYTFTLNTTAGIINTIPAVGNSLRGKYKDYVSVYRRTGTGSGPFIIYTFEEISDLYLFDPALSPTPNTKFVYKINEIGWYSYKVVVKQQQQDYYNVYLPGMLDGYPSGQTYGSQVIYTGSGVTATSTLENGINTTDFPVGEDGKTGHIVLINDNINKVPRDLVEVGPDQKLYRSSVQLFGKVSNAAKIIPVLAVDVVYNLYATSIRYKLSDNGGTGSYSVLHNVRIGDGIQSVEAKIPLGSTPPYTPNPDAWMANTVVTSNTLVAYDCICNADTPIASSTITVDSPHAVIAPGDIFTYTIGSITYDAEVLLYTAPNIITFTVATYPTVLIPNGTFLHFTNPDYGIITFTPSNITRAGGGLPHGDYINYIVTSAENTQYYPTRQPDTVTAIATATDYNFLANSIDNVRGTAGLNFYQLQTNPSIGRVATINPIGVKSSEMIPFLGVYETRPVDSLLALFWETASTGYISDLNWDVLTGYNGPARFSDLGFRFFEDQDPLGTNIALNATGDSDCPYITDEFYIENNTGITISPLSLPIIFSVYNASTPNVDYTSSFTLVGGTSIDTYRIKITPTSNFVFDHYADSDSNFTFTIKVEWGTIGQFANLTFSGRLGNIAPSFDHAAPYYDRFVTQEIITNVVTVTAKNGAHTILGTINQNDLYWDITAGNSMDYFSIDNAVGQINLIRADIPLGVYDLHVRVRDAVIPPAPGTPLIGPGVFQTLEDNIIVRITVGPKPVPPHLQYFDSNPIAWELASTCTPGPGQGYAAVHVGVDNLTLDLVTHINNKLPDLTTTTNNPSSIPPPDSKAYQNYVNVQIANGATGPGGPDPATGLTQGALEWEVIGAGNSSANEGRVGTTQFILYYRPLMSAPNTNSWQPVLDENGIIFPASTVWQSGTAPTGSSIGSSILVNFPDTSPNADFAQRSTKFITTVSGEYCLIIKATYRVVRAIDPPDCGPQCYSSVIVKDANYDYLSGSFVPPVLPSVPVTTEPFPAPSITPIEYNVGIKQEYNSDYPSGVPYDDQDATVGFEFATDVTLYTSTPVGPAVGSNKIQVNEIDPRLVPGLYAYPVVTPYFSILTQITDIDYTTNTITLSTQATTAIPTGAAITFRTYPGRVGSVWAATNNGLHVDQFYTDSSLVNVWIPPVANKFYVYQNKNLEYSVGPTFSGMPEPTDKPFFCAKFNEHGGVVPILSPGNTVLTAWKFDIVPNVLENHGRNMFQATL